MTAYAGLSCPGRSLKPGRKVVLTAENLVYHRELGARLHDSPFAAGECASVERMHISRNNRLRIKRVIALDLSGLGEMPGGSAERHLEDGGGLLAEILTEDIKSAGRNKEVYLYEAKVLEALSREEVIALSTLRGRTAKQFYTAKDVRAIRELLKPATPLGGRYRALGILIALTAVLVFLAKRTPDRWKWYALARFLLGVGGEFRIPDELAAQWDNGLADEVRENTYLIKPYGALFWVVGSMHVRVEDGYVQGEDVYDFHPQPCGGYDHGYGWAVVGAPGDPTTIRPPKWAVWLLKKAFPALMPRYIKVRRGLLVLSDNLWNALGGRPFKSVLRYRITSE